MRFISFNVTVNQHFSKNFIFLVKDTTRGDTGLGFLVKDTTRGDTGLGYYSAFFQCLQNIIFYVFNIFKPNRYSDKAGRNANSELLFQR